MAKILIVEDEKMMVQPLTSKLEEEGHEVEVAYDGEEGLKKALEILPDIILLDIIMPKLDGISVLNALRSHEETKEIPVIVLSNLSDSNKVEQSLQEGATDYLVKTDWSLSQVIDKVNETLHK